MTKVPHSLACMEVGSAALGYRLLNVIAHAKDIRILEGSVVDAGRFLILAEGPHTELANVLKIARTSSDATDPDGVIDQELIEHPHKNLLSSVYSLHHSDLKKAIMIVETETASGLLSVAQALLKHNGIDAIELKIGRGNRGRGLGFFTGDVKDVAAGAEDARTRLKVAVRVGRVEVLDTFPQAFREFFSLSGD